MPVIWCWYSRAAVRRGGSASAARSVKVTEALEKRKSTRAFLDRAVEPHLVQELLDAACHAPSGANTQPWQVAVVTGDSKRRLQRHIEQAYQSGQSPHPDYVYYPTRWEEPYRSRRKSCGLQLYSALHIERGDRQRQREQWAANYRAFDAPVALLFFMDACRQTGSFLDYGMFLQSLMLAAVEKGLASCPQAALAEYPRIVKQQLGYPADCLLVCGVALGYEDTQAAVNRYRVPREPASRFTRWFD
jgi:nitroreductase